MERPHGAAAAAPSGAVLWIGGSSGLACTYLEELGACVGGRRRNFLLACPEPPEWPIPEGAAFVHLDLLSAESVRTLFERLPCRADALIFGVRLSLVLGGDRHILLTRHLEALLSAAVDAGVRQVLHVSSVAVADHVRSQFMASEDEPLPPLESYRGHYDVFKRVSEDLITRSCEARGLAHAHLRISGIFSNGPSCIQVAAMWLQAPVGSYWPRRIDFNSSRNVAEALGLLLERLAEDPTHAVRLYYYTRATAEPVAYGRILADFRCANKVWYGVWLPSCILLAICWLFHIVARSALRFSQLVQSLDYLAMVWMHDHTFDNSRFRRDFPQIAEREESLLEAFRRIRRRRQEAKLLQRDSSRSE